jgi:hypothetical protein
LSMKTCAHERSKSQQLTHKFASASDSLFEFEVPTREWRNSFQSHLLTLQLES